jgi:hypothetical protein
VEVRELRISIRADGPSELRDLHFLPVISPCETGKTRVESMLDTV